MRDARIGDAVAKARCRLARVAGRRSLARHAWWVIGAAALLAALRPLLWPLSELDPLWVGAARALLLLPVGLALGAAALLWWGRRQGPGALEAVRAMDASIGADEVLASGWAFERSGRATELEALARHRAARAASSFDADESFPLPSLRPRVAPVLLAFLLGFVAVLIGAWDPVLASVLMHPPGSSEVDAASELEAAAAALTQTPRPDADRERRAERDMPEAERAANDARDADHRELAHKARDAARAARRGDRRGALRRLDELRREAGQRARRARALEAALRRLAANLDVRRPRSTSPGPGPREGAGAGSERSADRETREASRRRTRSPGQEAADEMRLLARRLRGPEGAEMSDEERRRTLERLTRGASEARGQSASRRATEALARAAEALSRGESAEAARALDEAAERAESLSIERREAARSAEALARLLERAGVLERAVQLAMMGREGEGQGAPAAMGAPRPGARGEGAEGNMLVQELAARLAALGLSRGGPGRGRPAAGPGGHVPDPGDARRPGIDADGELHARSLVREGERAIEAIQGLGAAGQPTREFRDVYPSYGAIVEDSLDDEAIPAARRAVVRRYFESIRPGHDDPSQEQQDEGSER